MTPNPQADPTRAHHRTAGFALILVLWWLGLLALLGTRITASGREAAETAHAMFDRASMRAIADGAVNGAILQVANGAWQAHDPPHRSASGRFSARVRVEDEGGRINPNDAPPGLLAALLRTLGLPADRAASLAAAITDWHTAGDRKERLGAKSAEYRAAGRNYGPADAPFTSTAELGLVLGMDDAVLARLAPHLSVATEGDVDRSVADPVVRAALATFGRNVLPAGIAVGRLADIYRITADIAGPDGARFTRAATIRVLRANDPQAPPLEILAWDGD